MFLSDTKLPHLLAPHCYIDPDFYQIEMERVLRESWHVVGTTAELERPGDFITCSLANTCIHIRNFDGQLRALSNVCAHRHALICSQEYGNAATMRCQYHGWEYQEDGRTGRIPEPKNFIPIDREQLRLPAYHVACAGQVVFVNLSESPRPLADFLGRDFYQKLEERTSSDWSLALRWQPKFDVNWKIPVENSLEAYHVPAVHPHTFREDPGSDRSEHRLLSNRTWFSTQLPFSPHSRLDSTFQSFEGRFVRWLGYEPTARYEQHHVFPNLLFSFTDAITLINCIHPTGPRSCSAVVRQFGRLPARPSRLKRLMAQGWSRLTAAITKKVLMEDVAIFSAIQAGVSSSPHAGVLGRCEERIHSFQAYLQCTIDGTCHD